MRYVRAAALSSVLGSFILAAAGCSGGSGGATPPISVPDQSTVATAPQQPATDTTTTSDSTTTTTATTQSTALSETFTSGVPRHVMAASILWGYSGIPHTISIAQAAPWLNWVQTSAANIPAMHAAGLKVNGYVNFWRDYSVERPPVGYDDLKPGGAHAGAEARTCSGSVIHDYSYGGGYEADARSSAAVGHANVVADYAKTSSGNRLDALFADDTGAMGGIPLPCNWSVSAYQSATARVLSSLRIPVLINSLGAGDPVEQVGYTMASNVIGAMCELCYSGNRLGSDYVTMDSRWVSVENSEALMAARHKIFWAYPRAIGDASRETKLRTYVYASFLLSYAPEYAMLQEVMYTPDSFPVLPEVGLVPMNPLSTASTVTGYLRSGGAYMREFGSCYYLGVNKGRCAVVVNPSSRRGASVPTSAFAHSMTLSGYSVLDGGRAGFGGGRVTSLAPGSAAILFQ